MQPRACRADYEIADYYVVYLNFSSRRSLFYANNNSGTRKRDHTFYRYDDGNRGGNALDGEGFAGSDLTACIAMAVFICSMVALTAPAPYITV